MAHARSRAPAGSSGDRIDPFAQSPKAESVNPARRLRLAFRAEVQVDQREEQLIEGLIPEPHRHAGIQVAGIDAPSALLVSVHRENFQADPSSLKPNGSSHDNAHVWVGGAGPAPDYKAIGQIADPSEGAEDPSVVELPKGTYTQSKVRKLQGLKVPKLQGR